MTARIIKTFTLEGFDLTHNGTISQETFDEVTSGSFVKQGHNLLIVGGNGSGKTSIANCAVLNAQERGHTCEKLWTPSTFMPHDHLVEQDIAIGHLGDGRVHYRSHLIDADLLVVEDTQSWLEICPVVPRSARSPCRTWQVQRADLFSCRLASRLRAKARFQTLLRRGCTADRSR